MGRLSSLLCSAVFRPLNYPAAILTNWPKKLSENLGVIESICKKASSSSKSKSSCFNIPKDVYQRPNPLIYDQYYLSSLGYAVTWDNPDIEILQDGLPAEAHDLAPDTEYEIVARIWNGSFEAPAVGLPVRFGYLSFGIGTVYHTIGTTYIDLPVKGVMGDPASARHHWRTPGSPGHYCIQVFLDWPDYANPYNNVGQQNTDVKSFNSPRATFEFAVSNNAPHSRNFSLRADSYVLQPLPECNAQVIPGNQEGRRARKRAPAHSRQGEFPVPDAWRVDISPNEFVLKPKEECQVTVRIIAPENHSGARKSFNINGFVGDKLIGGVTLHAGS